MFRRVSPSLLLSVAVLAGALFALLQRLVLPQFVPLPGSESISLPVLIMFGAIALALIAVERRHERWAYGAIALVAVGAGVALWEALSGDGSRLLADAGVTNGLAPRPGHVAPSSAVAFLFAALALFAHLSRRRRPAASALSYAAASAVAILAIGGLGVYLLDLGPLYRGAGFNAMHPPAAVGFVMVAAALWLLPQDAAVQAASHDPSERRISRAAMTILTVVAACAGIGGYLTLRTGLEASIASQMEMTATTEAAALNNLIEDRLALTHLLLAHVPFASALTTLDHMPDSVAARRALEESVNGFEGTGLTRVQVFDIGHRLVAASGDRTPARDEYALNLGAGSRRFQLFLRDGHFGLATEDRIVGSDGDLGTVTTEQYLPLADWIVTRARTEGATGDLWLCAADEGHVQCLPSRLEPLPFTLPLYGEHKRPAFPITSALLGQSGVSVGTDARARSVFTGYAPVGNFGLGLLVKVDRDEIYGPLHRQLQLLLLGLGVLIVSGAMLLRHQVGPLLREIIRERQRNDAILENANDAFVALDERGRVTHWNAMAERLFGWTREEVLGQRLEEVILAPDERAQQAALFDRGTAAGRKGRRLELQARHRDGHRLPIEMALTPMGEREGMGLFAFLRDISERREFEARLIANEKRLVALTRNVPGYLAQVDRSGHYRFVNAPLATALGRPVEAIIGQKVFELHPELKAAVEPYLGRALQGEAVQFELSSGRQGSGAYLQCSLTPERDDGGNVVGFYVLATDITEQKRNETRLRESENRLAQLAREDALTGLPNRRQFTERLDQALRRARRSQTPIAVLFLDVDRFKAINDQYGHGVGDKVLRELARRLRYTLRTSDVPARLAGDEFVVILDPVEGEAAVHSVAEKVLASLREPFDVGGRPLSVSASIGAAIHRGTEEVSTDQMMEVADEALYAAKHAGRDRAVFRTVGVEEGV